MGKLIVAIRAPLSSLIGDKPLSALTEAVAAMAIVAITDPTYDSNMSAPIPATSPTLSPTLSAITAGFLGSSSGIPASTFPTKSAPTSAVFVKIPPPTRANKAIEDAPIAKPLMFEATVESVHKPKTCAKVATPKRPNPATARPITAPPEKAVIRAGPCPC